MVHQVSAGFQGTAIDIDIQAREILKANDLVARILHEHTGQDLDRIKADIQRDYFMSAPEAVEYGLVDEVMVRGSETIGRAAATTRTKDDSEPSRRSLW